MLSAPLHMSNDLREIGAEYKEILLNRHVIEVDQDPLGRMARVVIDDAARKVQVWVKKLSRPQGSFAILYFNRNILGSWRYVSIILIYLLILN